MYSQIEFVFETEWSAKVSIIPVHMFDFGLICKIRANFKSKGYDEIDLNL